MFFGLRSTRYFFSAVIAFVVVTAAILLPVATFAQGANDFGLSETQGQTVLQTQSLPVTVARIIQAALGLLGVVAVVIVLYGGFVYMTAGGNDEKVMQARKILVNGGVGLILILSSFGIARFVLNKLTEATQGGGPTDALVGGGIGGGFTTGDVCQTNSILCCSARNFVVKSITPRTDATNMNNGRIRTIFSRSIQGNVTSTLRVTLNGNTITDQFTFSFLDPENQVIEGVYNGQSACPNETGCLPQGSYRITVAPEVSDRSGNRLVSETSCGTFPTEAAFTVNTPSTLDLVWPGQPGGLVIDGRQGQDIPLTRGRVYTVSSTMVDNTGIGYARLEIVRDGGGYRLTSYDGPTIVRGSDASQQNPFNFQYPLSVGLGTEAMRRYVVTSTVHDIDGNSSVETSSFVVVGETCANGLRDGDETAVDIGGSCPGVGSCTANWQCASARCVNNQCLASPIITDVSLSDGASGNLITIFGLFFGNAGTVEFGRDTNADGTPDAWAPARLAQAPAACVNRSSWNDTWIVVEVPGDATLPNLSASTIRVRRTDDPNLFDTTTDDRGPRPGRNGLFTKDNQLQRPGIYCAVTPNNLTAGRPTTPVVIHGQGFGTSRGSVSFGEVAGGVGSWTENRVETSVPENMLPGISTIRVELGTRRSNQVEFTVLGAEEAGLPIISTVDPARGAPNSLITISGSNFGDAPPRGIVYLSTDQNATCRNGEGCTALAIPPATCPVTWTNTQVIARIPEGVPAGSYYLILQSGAGATSRGTVRFEVTTATGDRPIPGICDISPNEGPAPLSRDSSLRINGMNLVDLGAGAPQYPTVYFWRAGAQPGDLGTWLSARFPTVRPTTLGDRNSELTTPIPVGADGISMQSGPIRVAYPDGRVSNSMSYTVRDCRNLPPLSLPDGYRCCTTGPEAGILKLNGLICAGEVREAGYVWRFTTGKIPNIPYVVEECEPPLAPVNVPSPTPRGRDACVNAGLRVRFNMTMDPNPALLAAAVQVYTCGNAGEVNCANKQNVTNQFVTRLQGQVLEIASATTGQNLQPNTWYRVELDERIRSQEVIRVLGQSQVANERLKKTRPCGGTTAYCYEFRTGTADNVCRLQSVSIHPPTHTTSLLGMVQDPGWDYDVRNQFNPPHPLYYYLWGRANRECTVVPVDGLGWRWETSNTAQATAAESRLEPTFTDSRGTATAYQDTTPGSVRIQVVGTAVNPYGPLRGESALTVNLGDPEIVSYWPNCIDACANSIIGIQFNRQMMLNTYAGAVTLTRCEDHLCSRLIGGAIAFIDAYQDPFTYRVNLPPGSDPLLPNTWYRVQVANTIRAVGSIDPTTNQFLPGKNLNDFEWRFRTKAVDALCVIDTVKVEPSPFTARTLGEKTEYAAIPHASPDACSRFGQELNPWGYGWNWSTVNQSVAAISQFASVGSPKPVCTYNCLPRGSNIARSTNEQFLCGNGIVETEAGEDCDIGRLDAAGNLIETIGVSCSTRCLRPGNTRVGTTGVNVCGNGEIDTPAGEECDEGSGQPRTNWRFCTATCTNKGTPPFAGGTSGGRGELCGDEEIAEQGEDCDISLAMGRSLGAGCSTSCLHTGNDRVARAFCDATTSTTLKTTGFCRDAVSVCGNGFVESGEQCERDGNSTNSILLHNPQNIRGTRTAVIGNPARVCSDQCLLQNLQDEVNLPTAVRCVPGTVGCTSDGRFTGSSIVSNPPAQCGDGVVGIGEYPQCEYGPGEGNRQSSLGLDPRQVVTAIGSGTVNPQTFAQQTQVVATPTRVRRDATRVEQLTVPGGQGQYSLQCGYTEYTVAQNGLYNNCAENISNRRNAYGVGTNSCCFVRPTRTSEYPVDGSTAVCQNTSMDVTLGGTIDESTLSQNIILARGQTTPCVGGADMTAQVRATIASGDVPSPDRGFLGDVWDRVRGWLTKTLVDETYASSARTLANGLNWCRTTSIGEPTMRYEAGANTVTSTIVSLPLNEALDPNTTYSLILRGGRIGIKDVRGVGILPGEGQSQDDSFVFRTGSEICRLERVSVNPAAGFYNRPNMSVNFVATAYSRDNQRIDSIANVYAWEWLWGPTQHPVFAIPNVITEANRISSQNLEGTLNAYVNARELPGGSIANGRLFTAPISLTAKFCENPWPALLNYPYEDGNPPGRTANNDMYDRSFTDRRGFTGGPIAPVDVGGVPTYFNFSMGYCADAGKGNDTTDDLPYLRPVVFTRDAAASSQAVVIPPLTPLGSVRSSPTTLLGGPTALAFDSQRNLLFVAAQTSGAVAMVDVRDAQNPRYLTSVGNSTNVLLFQPSAVAVSGNFVYVLANNLRGSNPGSLQILEIAGNTLRPRGNISHGEGTSPNTARLVGAKAIVVRGNYAYVTVSSPLRQFNGLQIFDIRNPDQPTPVGYINDGERGAVLLGARGLAVDGNYAYVTVTGSGWEGMTVFDVSNPQQPFPASRLVGNIGGLVGITDIVVRGNVVYILASGASNNQTGAGIGILDVSSRGEPSIMSVFSGGANFRGATDIDLVGNTLFVAAPDADAIHAIDITGTTFGTARTITSGASGTAPYLLGARAILATNTTLYVAASRSNAVQLFAGPSGWTSTPVQSAQSRVIVLPDETLKRFLFFTDKNDDVIGIQIFSNPDRQTARAWFEAHGFSDTGNMRDVPIDGYDAISDGTNYYINAVNVSSAGPQFVDNYIYLFSINDSADANTRAVFGQLIKSLSFNINLTNFGQCAVGNARTNLAQPDAILNKSCDTDFDCLSVSQAAPQDRVCANERTKMLRDLVRLKNIQTAQKALEDYKVGNGRGKYPALRGGTYYPGYSVSHWPSWGRELGPLLQGKLALDPVNNWARCGANDIQTCWDPAQKQYICPAVMQVYEYKTNSDGSNYTLHANFEYLQGSSPIVAQFIPKADSFIAGRWCQAGQPYSSFAQVCGDGIVNTTGATPEECDPAAIATRTVACSATTQVQETCSTTCRWERGANACVESGTCGNGIVEGTERCDDGSQNGQYGYCAGRASETVTGLGAGNGPVLSCQGPHPERCGNNRIDFRNGRPLEQCDISQTAYQTGFCEKARGTRDAEYGLSWRNRNVANQNNTLKDVHLTSATSGWIVGANGTILRMTDGRTWGAVPSGVTEELSSVAFVGQNNGWIVGANGVILSTTNGQTWVRRTSGTNALLSSVYFVNDQVGWAVGALGTVLKSTDGGVTWGQQALGTNRALTSVYFVSDRQGVVVGDQGAIYRTTDGGASWSQAGLNTASGNRTLTVAGFTGVFFADTQVGWVTAYTREPGSNAVFGTLFRTTNGGASWSVFAGGQTGDQGYRGLQFADRTNGWVIGESGEIRRFATSTDSVKATAGTAHLNAIHIFDGVTGWMVGNNGNIWQTGYMRCNNNNDCGAGDQCVSLAQPEYDIKPDVSCALNCQRQGGYCGDGQVQVPFEQCDGTTGCTNSCLTRTIGTVENVASTQSGSCGNGIINSREVCDDGDGRNGQRCIPGYGQECTYCASDCQTVLTAQATAYCGNRQIDFSQPNAPIEQCETNALNQVITQSSSANTPLVQACANFQRGAYQCANSCQSLVNGCVTCGTKSRAQGGAIPKISVLNPMLGNNSVTANAAEWSRMNYVAAVNMDLVSAPNRQANGQAYYIGYTKFAVPGSSYADHRIPHNLFVTDPGEVPHPFQGLETSLSCSTTYKLDFNSMASQPVQTGAGERRGDFFDYTVLAERDKILREYIVSPPVPTSTFRVVVRWSKQEFDQGDRFAGLIYNQTFAGGSNSAIFSYLRATADSQAGTDRVCDDVELRQAGPFQGYWMPAGCTPYGNNTIAVHPLGSLNQTFIQSFTINPINQINGTPSPIREPFAVVVQNLNRAIGRSTGSRNVVVEVYDYHNAQIARTAVEQQSIYKPRLTLQLSKADLGSETAAYWHVFNIVWNPTTNRHEIQRLGANANVSEKHGIMETDFQGVLQNIPPTPTVGSGQWCTGSVGELFCPCRNTAPACEPLLYCETNSGTPICQAVPLSGLLP